ncbi:hypothetical protein N3K66_008413 [Trichothecium roseum]|uniref:Uncharacterized protein n=1 Tax=Trichothecium roseum TaxID=47278 RepID=A0ACC0UQA7_9HYPO|nr:hypothetical protein N3K66_008413 [Trichothecium roseum]
MTLNFLVIHAAILNRDPGDLELPLRKKKTALPDLAPLSTRAIEKRRAVADTQERAPGLFSATMNFNKPPVPRAPGIYRYTATAMGAGMWFWLMYRAKKDGPVLLGWKHPWDH